MSSQLISHPFRLAPSGSIVTRPDGSDEYLSEQLAILILTKPGEREVVPSFGLRDPTFDTLDIAMLQAQVTLFGPAVNITKVAVNAVTDERSEIIVTFDTIAQATTV